MAVKIRMSRIGRRHRPFFRINAIDSRAPRNGKILEKLGHYDPLVKDPEKQIVLNLERIKHWLDNGAICSDTVAEILRGKGIKTKHAEARSARRAKAREQARKAGKFFTKAEKVLAEKKAEEEAKAAEEKAKAEAEAKAKAEAEAKAKAEAEANAVEEAAVAEAEAERAKEEAPAEEAPAEEEKPAEE